jgi:hypothetical protein
MIFYFLSMYDIFGFAFLLLVFNPSLWGCHSFSKYSLLVKEDRLSTSQASNPGSTEHVDIISEPGYD